MASLTVYSRTGAQVGTYDIDPTDLAPTINKQLLHDVVVMYQSNLRLGTAKTKSRGEVAGSTKKMYRQKGTGNARAGSRRSGIRRGGGHIFAKRPRDWTFRLPRKAVQLATRMALAAKLRDSEVTLIDELKFDSPKTKDMAAVLKALGISGNSLLVATAEHDVNVYKSARNIDKVEVTPISGLNALNLLRPKRVLMTKAALDSLRSAAKKGAEGKPAASQKSTTAGKK
jgi:large subunit ribosomal protein L4